MSDFFGGPQPLGATASPTFNDLTLSEDAGQLWRRPAASSLNSIPYGAIVNQNPFTDGSGVGGENYSNEVVAMGWNLSSTVGVPSVSAKAAVWDTWESKYNIAGKYHVERHAEMADTAGTQHRFWSFALPHDGGTGSAHLVAVDSIVWKTFDILSTPVQWDLKNNRAFFGSASTNFQLNFSKNNSAPFTQRNAADSAAINLPYIDSSDRLVLTGRIQSNPGTIAAGGNNGVSFTWNNGEVGDSAVLLNISAATQTGVTFYGLNITGAASFGMLSRLRNTAGLARQEIVANSGQDALIDLLSGTQHFAIGIDGSDSNKLKISRSQALGTNDAFTMDTSGNIVLAGTLALAQTVNSVSPTAPNRTVTMVINGATYYLHAKTTND